MNFGITSASIQGMTATAIGDPGLLIAFEGLDGSGKTTQRKLLKAWLESNGEDVVVTKWNSSPLFKDLTKAKKALHRLDPHTYSVLHAADFRHRYETVIQPSLREGKIVLADRYIFTGLARDVARGVSRARVADLYSSVRRPDITFYFSAAPLTSAARITASREIKFYEAGQDVTALENPLESYLRFASKVMEEYARLHREFQFVVVDAERPIYGQHLLIRKTYEKYLTASTGRFQPIPVFDSLHV